MRDTSTVPGTVAVWDPFVRLFHWVLVTAVAGALLSADEAMTLHRPLGYVILGLVVARVVWGVAGRRHARFADFVRGPAAVLSDLRGLVRGRPHRHLGHGPAGGAMVVALLAALALTAGSGLLADRPQAPEALEAVHEAAAWLTVGLVSLHVGGVVASSLVRGENLVRAMITGRKRRT